MNSVKEPKEDTSTWLCSVNSIVNLSTEEQQQNRSVTLTEVDITYTEKDIKRVKEILRQQTVLNINKKTQESQLVRRLLRERNQLIITDKDILVRSLLENRQIVLTSSNHHKIFQKLHENMAHPGAESVYHLAKKRLYWSNMEKDIK